MGIDPDEMPDWEKLQGWKITIVWFAVLAVSVAIWLILGLLIGMI